MKRRDNGWIALDGEAFLERGAPMSDTGNPAWMVWIKARPEDIVEDEYGAYPVSGYGANGPCRTLAEITGHPEDGTAWFTHLADEGWRGDAERSARIIIERRATAQYATTDRPADCPTCGSQRVIDIDRSESDAEPFAWCESCGVATFRSEESDYEGDAR